MLVDVVRMRQRGQKLDAAEYEDPVRGELRMYYWNRSDQGGQPAARIRAVQLLRECENRSPAAPNLIPALHHAEVTQIRDGSLVVVGLESLTDRGERGEWEQAWWCKVVE